MKILFINPPSVSSNILKDSLEGKKVLVHQTVSMPMGILYLCAVLEKEFPNHKLEIIDIAKEYHFQFELERNNLPFTITLEKFLDQCLELNTSSPPDIVGISTLFSTSHKTTILISKLVKKKWPNAIILVGGMHATSAVPSLLENNSIDYVVRGEAEISIIKFIKQIEEKVEPDVEGFIDQRKLRAGLTQETCQLPMDLDSIPLPAWHLLDMSKYIQSAGRSRVTLSDIEQHMVATIITSRGCPFQCTFCASHTVHGRQIRYRSPKNVVAELDFLTKNYKINKIVPEDDLFACKKDRFLKLVDAIEERKYNLQWQFPNGLSVAILDEDVVNAMIRLGMTIIAIAVESGSDYVQRHVIKKNCNLEKAKRIISYSRSTGLFTRAYFILGFPGETKEQMQETIEYAKNVRADWCNFGIAAPLIGSEMYYQLLSRGDIDQDFNWDSAFPQERVYDTNEIKAKELKSLCYKANIKINFLNNINLIENNFKKALSIFDGIVKPYPFHIIGHYCMALSYKGLNNLEMMFSTFQKIKNLISQDSRAAELFSNFKDDMPEYLDYLNSTAPPSPMP